MTIEKKIKKIKKEQYPEFTGINFEVEEVIDGCCGSVTAIYAYNKTDLRNSSAQILLPYNESDLEILTCMRSAAFLVKNGVFG